VVVLSRLLLSVTLCLPYLAYAQAYKCIVNGASVFQQQPCTGGTKLDVPPPPDPNSRDGRIALAVAKKQVFIGMSEEEVVRSWGKPNKINRSVNARNIHEQWIYERGEIGNSQYLYIEDGVVRSIQSS
jgi:Protein of unknown function (DUF2845)